MKYCALDFLDSHLFELFDAHASELNALLTPMCHTKYDEPEILLLYAHADTVAARAWRNGLYGDSRFRVLPLPEVDLPEICRHALAAYSARKRDLAYADGFAWSGAFHSLPAHD